MKSTITSYSPMHSSSSSIFTNFPLISAFIAFTVAQSIKFFTTWYREKIWDLKQLVASGGMPSSHSATVTALAAAIGFQDGIGGPVFATSVIFACISRVNTRVFLSSWRRKVIPVVIVGAFLCAFVLYQQVMYDAFGVRLQAGRQAEVLNQIVYELPAEHPLAESRPLRELLGHTPPQVIAGALLGILTATIGHLIVRIAS